MLPRARRAVECRTPRRRSPGSRWSRSRPQRGSSLGRYPAGMRMAPSSNGNGASNRPDFGFRKPLNSPALLIVLAGDAGLEPAMDLAAESVAQHRFHAVRAHRVEAVGQSLQSAEALQLQLAETDPSDVRRTLDVRERADRLVQHQRHGRGGGHRRVGLPILGRRRAARRARCSPGFRREAKAMPCLAGDRRGWRRAAGSPAHGRPPGSPRRGRGRPRHPCPP